jgi:hypothetical protein
MRKAPSAGRKANNTISAMRRAPCAFPLAAGGSFRNKSFEIEEGKGYESLTSNKQNFKEFLLSCPKMDEHFEIERFKDYPKIIEL